MVSLKRYASIPLYGLFTAITAANMWTGVNAQEDYTGRVE
jgi:cytochrome c oxidase assembly protein Cox11